MARSLSLLAATAACALALAAPASADHPVPLTTDEPSAFFEGAVAALRGDTVTFAVAPGAAARLTFDVQLMNASDIALALTLPDGSVLDGGGMLSGQARHTIVVERPAAGTYTLAVDGRVDGRLDGRFEGTAQLALPAAAAVPVTPAAPARTTAARRCAKKARKARKARRARRSCRR